MIRVAHCFQLAIVSFRLFQSSFGEKYMCHDGRLVVNYVNVLNQCFPI